MEKVDRTIGIICDWIQANLLEGQKDFEVAAMIRALAELVSARNQPEF